MNPFRNLKVIVLALTLLWLPNLGCHKVTITDAPTGVVNVDVATWYQATGAVLVWSQASLKLTDALITLHEQGILTSEDAYTKMLVALGRENQLGLQASHFLQLTPQHFDSTTQSALGAILDQGMAEFLDAERVGLIQIHDPNIRAEVNAGVAALQASLKTIFALVKPAGTPLPVALVN